MGKPQPGGRLAAAAALIAVVLPVAATSAAPPSFASLRIELEAAIADEQRALDLLTKVPPRDGAAELKLNASMERLRHIHEALKGSTLEPWVRQSANAAAGLDSTAASRLPPLNQAIREIAMDEIEKALAEKHQLMGALTPAQAPGGSQCADGRDNDGDQLVDARYESGCTSGKDASERSPLTCSLGYGVAGGLSQVEGTCTGTFAKLEIVAPPGATFDTKRPPVVVESETCRYSSPSRLECVMGDGADNPGHVVKARFRLQNASASARPRLFLRDFARRGRFHALKASAAGRPTADLGVEAKVASSFLDKNGHGRVTGTLLITSARKADAVVPYTLLVTSNRLESARAVTVEPLVTCKAGQTGTECAMGTMGGGSALAFSWAMPVSGAGRLTVTFELVSDATDPQPANNKATVEAELRASP